MTFKLKSPTNPETLFVKVEREIMRHGGNLEGDFHSGTIEGQTIVGPVRVKYERKGDYYYFTKISGSFLATEDEIKKQIKKYFNNF